MKKIVLFSLFLVSALGFTNVKAQTIFSENFDALTAPGLPVGWTQYNGDM
ncbi:MAG: hypothetical protein RIQ33_1783, partial [Bacteroidota bacterium]